jgi:protein-disulfide isomerase
METHLTLPRPTGAPWKLLAFALVALGWLASGYLLLRVLALGGGPVPGIDVCSAIFGRSCDRTLLVPESRPLGVPLASWGLLYFAAAGFLLAFESPRAQRALLLLVGAGCGASLILAATLVSGSEPLCPICLVVHVLNLGLFAVLARSASLPTATPVTPGRRVAGTLAAILIGAVVQGGLLRWGSSGGGGIERAALLHQFQAGRKVELPAHPNDARLGKAEAPVQLVVFSSFQCPGCRLFAWTARHLKKHFGGRLALVYKYFPLGKGCNPLVKVDMQPRSCEAAWAAEAARRQGAFWAYHDGLFATDLSDSDATLRAVAAKAGLDPERWEADRKSAATRAHVRSEVLLGLLRGVTETPTVFLNGRRVRDLRLPALKFLIQHELETAPTLQGDRVPSASPRSAPPAPR